jgi:hypothetical protein
MRLLCSLTVDNAMARLTWKYCLGLSETDMIYSTDAISVIFIADSLNTILLCPGESS